MEFLTHYGLFLAQIVTVVVAILVAVAGVFAIISKDKPDTKEKLSIHKRNDRYEQMKDTLQAKIMSKNDYKSAKKDAKKIEKAKKGQSKRNIFLLEFKGDIKASSVENLRNEISAILTVATPQDEVLINIESPGGMVHGYGLAASQLQRLREKNIPLIACVDKVAASGGYLMACVADKIYAAPFAIIGSIGVVAQLPNFNRLLKKHNIDFEQMTAGEHKRTLTLFGENTDKARKKFQEDIEVIHDLFKDFISKHRQQVDITQVATGEHWLAINAMELNLVDELITSDDYLMTASVNANIYEIKYKTKKSFAEKFMSKMQQAMMTWHYA